MSYFIVSFNEFRKKAEYVAIQYHKKDHGYGLHHFILGCKPPVDFTYPSDRGYKRLTINDSIDVDFLFGKKRKKLTIKIRHGSEPISFNVLKSLDSVLKFNLDLLYKFDFKGDFNVKCFELHYGNEGFRADGLKDYYLHDLITFLEPLFQSTAKRLP